MLDSVSQQQDNFGDASHFSKFSVRIKHCTHCRRCISFCFKSIQKGIGTGLLPHSLVLVHLWSLLFTLRCVIERNQLCMWLDQRGCKQVTGIAAPNMNFQTGSNNDFRRHTGIVVYGNEYYYGGGIQHTPVGKTPYGKPLKVVELGITHLPKEIFEEYLQDISPRYTAETYSLLHHNCNNFSNELACFLVGCNIPEYILRLPEEAINTPMGALLLPMIKQLETTLRYGGVPEAPQLGSLSATPVVVEQRETSSLSNNRGNEELAVQEDVDSGNEKPLLVTTKDSSVILPAVGPGKLLSSDASLNVSTKGIDHCQKDFQKIELSERKQDETIQEDPLKDARKKVQEEITREFATIMSSGTLRASEAAALAARRVMERHGRLTVTTRQS